MGADPAEFWNAFDAAQRHAFAGQLTEAARVLRQARAVLETGQGARRAEREDLLTRLSGFIEAARVTPVAGPVPAAVTPEAPGSVARYEEALRTDPSRPELWLEAAQAHWQAGNPERARQLLRRVAASQFAERDAVHQMLSRWMSTASERGTSI